MALCIRNYFPNFHLNPEELLHNCTRLMADPRVYLWSDCGGLELNVMNWVDTKFSEKYRILCIHILVTFDTIWIKNPTSSHRWVSCKKHVLTHWSYVSLALTHWYVITRLDFTDLVSPSCPDSNVHVGPRWAPCWWTLLSGRVSFSW